MTMPGTDVQNGEYDVVICGTGIAGQTLARQLKLHFSRPVGPDARTGTVPHAARGTQGRRVDGGERGVLPRRGRAVKGVFACQPVFPQAPGLRYFWSSKDGGCLSERPEIGLREYGPYPSYQLDLGKLENDLARINQEAGVRLLDGIEVTEIELSQTGKLHEIRYQPTGNAHGPQTVKARWVVDAMGRRRYLQRKLGLTVKSSVPHSAAWWRVKGRADVCDLVSESITRWHERVPEEYATSPPHT